jgi:hypothetical protein
VSNDQCVQHGAVVVIDERRIAAASRIRFQAARSPVSSEETGNCGRTNAEPSGDLWVGALAGAVRVDDSLADIEGYWG